MWEGRDASVTCGCLYGAQYVSECPLGKIGTLSGPDRPSHLSPRLRPHRIIVGGGSREQAKGLWGLPERAAGLLAGA